MDEALTNQAGPGAEPRAPGMPAEAPLPMPAQRLSRFEPIERRRPLTAAGLRSVWPRRLVVLGLAALLAALAANEMRLVLGVSGFTRLEIAVLVLFTINVAWIGLPFVTALIGLLRGLAPRRRARAGAAPLASRTAVLMPVHNEDPARAAAALEAMGRDLVARGEAHAFDLILLSDTTHGDIALAEEEAVWELRRALEPAIRVYYRRRRRNTAHKSGNLRDFCERWGGAYDYLLVLDADSLMEGATIVELARRMEADPDAGLIQTVPRLHRATTLLGRVQQFASGVYGPLLTRGLAWWTGKEAPFWGHNAIIRTRAFVAAAGLPVLSGKPPFGGPILSHDFVEAALLRRGGWSVSIADDLEGSYEECPGSLVDLAQRDRRWCQGNLQHLRLLGARGLHWVSRLHLVAGIVAYLAAPLWLLFIASALALGFQYQHVRPDYFPPDWTLFPIWPQLDPERALRLFGLTLGVLLGPKLFGTLAVLASPRRLRAWGGPVFPISLFTEVLISALVAPILMLIHVGLVLDVFRGRDSGWRPRPRPGEGLPWSQVLYRHRWHTAAGVALIAVGWSISWQMLAWISPAVVGMLLAAPLSGLTGSLPVGRVARRLRLLRAPEEARAPALVLVAQAAWPRYRDAVERAPDLVRVACDPELRQRHLALTDRAAVAAHEVDGVEATAEKKLRDAPTLESAVLRLTAQERACVLAQPPLLQLLAGRGDYLTE